MNRFNQWKFITGLLAFPLFLMTIHTFLFINNKITLFQFEVTLFIALIWIIAYVTGSIAVKKVGRDV